MAPGFFPDTIQDQVAKFFKPPLTPVMHTVFGQAEENPAAFAANWGWLILGVILATYFACYVLAIRRQHTGPPGRNKLPCDRC